MKKFLKLAATFIFLLFAASLLFDIAATSQCTPIEPVEIIYMDAGSVLSNPRIVGIGLESGEVYSSSGTVKDLALYSSGEYTAYLAQACSNLYNICGVRHIDVEVKR